MMISMYGVSALNHMPSLKVFEIISERMTA